MWLRAIIFGIELVGFLLLCIFATIKFYSIDKAKEKRKVVIRELRFNIIYFTINFLIILSVFLFTYSSFVFLSYSKLILVTAYSVISSIFIIIIAFKKPKSKENEAICLHAFIILFIFISLFAIFGVLDIENKVVIYEGNETKTIIEPIMFSENQIGYTVDEDGNIKTYRFYYKDNNDLFFKELSESDVKVIEIENEDTYIEETATRKSYCKKEKKVLQADYIYTEANVNYTIYLNPQQSVEIKTN